MEMFLMVAAISLLGVVVTVFLFAAATATRANPDEQFAERQSIPLPGPRLAAAATASGPPMFFIPSASDKQDDRVPIEVLLLQLERHVRLEQAAAEAFLDAPTVKSLHMRTTSPLLH